MKINPIAARTIKASRFAFGRIPAIPKAEPLTKSAGCNLSAAARGQRVNTNAVNKPYASARKNVSTSKYQLIFNPKTFEKIGAKTSGIADPIDAPITLAVKAIIPT